METTRRHLSPGITQVIRAFETNDFSAIEPVFDDSGMSILRRWWRGEELGIASVVGDIWSYEGVLGANAILEQARLAGFYAGANVLDIACGIGGPGRILARQFQCRVHGVDMNPDAILIAWGLSKLEGLENLVTFQVGDRASLPVDSGIYDLVWGHGGWGFGDDHRKTWAEGFRVVRPGGRVCSGVSRADLGWIKDLGFADVQFHDDVEYTRKALELFLDVLNEQKQQIVAQAGEQVWTMFQNQKARQLSELDGQEAGLVVATK